MFVYRSVAEVTQPWVIVAGYFVKQITLARQNLLRFSYSNSLDNKIYIAKQQKHLTQRLIVAICKPCWVSLQTSAHILQNLLLWWNFSATPRGCALFCQIAVAVQYPGIVLEKLREKWLIDLRDIGYR